MGIDLLKQICRSTDLSGLPCSHPGFVGIESMCTRCGASISECGNPPTVPFSYILPGLRLTIPEITRLRNENFWGLTNRKKLCLVLDLDNTLLYATHSCTLTPDQISLLKTIPSKNYEKGLIFEICGGDVVVKLRPGAREFLQEASTMFDLSIFTAGSRRYAEEVAGLLSYLVGPLFGEKRWRVMSREDVYQGKRKSLDVLLAHERVVAIVDDNENAWSTCNQGNLIKISRYMFFRHRITEKYTDTETFLSLFNDFELEEKKEFARVLTKLKEVHTLFYGNGFDHVENGDVAKCLERVHSRSDLDRWCKGGFNKLRQVWNKFVF